jgi:4-amino-4-deoxy-L-arabinose transferase-like glycosyltransferase
MIVSVFSREPTRKLARAVFVAIFVFEALLGFYLFWRAWDRRLPGAENPFTRDAAYILPAEVDWHYEPVRYNYMAYSLNEKGGFQNPAGQTSAFFTPGYPLVLALLYKLFGYSRWPVLFFQAFCLTATFYALWRLSAEIFNWQVAWLVLALLVINIRFTHTVGYVLTECLFFLLIALVLSGVVRAVRQRNYAYRLCVWLGLLAGCAALVRSVFLPSIVVIAVVFLVCRMPLLKVLVFVLVAAGLFSTWIVRNYIHFGRVVVATGNESYLAWEDFDAYRQCSFFDTYRVFRSNGIRSQQILEEAARQGETDTMYLEKSSYLCRQAFTQWCKDNFGFHLWLCAWRLKALLMPYSQHHKLPGKLINSALWSLTFLPAFLAAFLLYRQPSYWIIMLIAAGMFAMPVMLGVDMYLRYHLPVHLLLTIPAGYFWYRCAFARSNSPQ